MPELPEVRAHAERLDAMVAGRVLTSFRPLSFTVLKTFSPDPSTAEGGVAESFGQRGKHLVLSVTTASSGPDGADDDRRHFVVHLMQGGRLVVDTSKAAKPRGGLARWAFEDGPTLLLREAGTERKAGVWLVAGDPELAEPLAHLGPDADRIDEDDLASRLAATSVRLHGFLRDQRQLAGLGRRLANEVCHRARLSPFAVTAKLDAGAVHELHAAIGACVAEGLAFERDRQEMSSAKDRPGAVHHRTGEPCPRCGDAVREVAYNAYTIHYCATCQTDGKVLADNTTSKFLK